MRCYAYSWRGKPAKAHKLLVRGKHLTAIALMTCAGILDCKIVHGSVDSECFYNSIQKHLPYLMSFNRINAHSVLVLDNASIHHVDGIQRMIESVGAVVLYLPPYSPDYNPLKKHLGK